VSAGTVAPTAAIGLSVRHAHLESVSVRTSAGLLIGGSVTGGTWKATAPMPWATTFRMVATARGGRPAKTVSRVVRWTTPEQPLPAGTIGISISPSPGEQVGMGATWVVQFSRPIPTADQPLVLQRLSAGESLSDPVGWHWWSATEVDGRPEQFWPLNEQATLSVNLDGLAIDGERLVNSSESSSFTVINQHIARISATTHEMQVYNGTQLVRTEPVSLGQPGFPTISGTLVVLSKTPVVFMNSATIGYPGLYAQNVYDDVAISTDGYYIHSANWDIYDHGRYNVSYGCVEQNPNDAAWFYNWSVPGDVVVITGTTLQASEADGEGDWNIPWSEFQPS
jgi:lipoprotein-anchoring transpeptidase ErfK/SrfK